MNFFVKKIVKSTLCSLFLLSSQDFGAAAMLAAEPGDAAAEVDWNAGRLSEFDPRSAGINQCHLTSFRVCLLKQLGSQWDNLSQEAQEFLSLCRCITKKTKLGIKKNFAKEMTAWIENQCVNVFEKLIDIAKERKQHFGHNKKLNELFPKFPGIVLWLRLLEQNPFPVLLNIRLVENPEQDTDDICPMIQILFTLDEQHQWIGQQDVDLNDIDLKQPLLVVDAVTNNAEGWQKGSESRTEKLDFLSNNFISWQLEMAASWMQENQPWGVEMTQASQLGDEFQECLRQAHAHGCWPIDWRDTLRASANRVLHTLEIKHIFPK